MVKLWRLKRLVGSCKATAVLHNHRRRLKSTGLSVFLSVSWQSTLGVMHQRAELGWLTIESETRAIKLQIGRPPPDTRHPCCRLRAPFSAALPSPSWGKARQLPDIKASDSVGIVTYVD